MPIVSPPVDVEYPDVTATTLAFGSCHKNNIKPNEPNIWNAISTLQPDAFLWTGDLVYSPKKGSIASLETLKEEYDKLKQNQTIGFSDFLLDAEKQGYLKGGYHATLDDHDYGANDCGNDIPELRERQNLLLDFLGVESRDIRRERNGIYSTLTMGKAPHKTKVIFLDTRSGRSKHCIPSVGASPYAFGLGSPLACLTRWITANLNLQNIIPSCRNGKVLDEDQWHWLEQHLLGSDAQVNIVVSSIQVLTTNKLFETWGQFPQERTRLLKLLNSVDEKKSVLLLSGDVHHGEISDSSRGVRRSSGRIIEVTSSGMTHSCTEKFYGPLCKPILERFDKHRFRKELETNYFMEKNFGSIHINWNDDVDSEMKVDIRNNVGKPVVSTGSLPLWSFESHMPDNQIEQILGPVDGYMLPLFIRSTFAVFLIIVSLYLRKKLFIKAFEEVSRRKQKEQ